MAKRRPKAQMLQFPPGGRGSNSIDVRKLLLEGQSAPTVLVPADIRKAIDARARELAEEAFALCKEHLERSVAFRAEAGYPERVLITSRALNAINQGGLGAALAHTYHDELQHVMDQAKAMQKSSAMLVQQLHVALEADD
jgi:hypothetical protein